MKAADKKYKDATPIETMNKIRNILHSLDVLTVENWLDSSVEDCYSLRVSVDGTSLGTNGKGTTQAYALASAYAELMERLQNQLIYNGTRSDKLKSHAGFHYVPDEKYLSFEEIVKNNEPWMDLFKSRVSVKDYAVEVSEDDPLSFFHAKAKEWFPDRFKDENHHDIIKRWAELNPPETGGKFACIPFYSVKEQRVTYIPYQILMAAYGSNGMASGNTPEEALVQAVSEIFERHVCIQQSVMQKISHPDIPGSYLKKYPYVCKTIENIEKAGPYRVIMKDCSLGKGFPVAGSIFADYEHQTHMVKFGAHPDFEIALERTLTETFQGRDLTKQDSFSEFFYDEEIPTTSVNLQNIITTGNGFFPVEFFSRNPTYEFMPPKEWETGGNREMLRDLLNLLLDQGHDILVRDVSFLGFPAFYVIVPHFSEIFDSDFVRIRELLHLRKVRDTLRNLDSASLEAFEEMIPFVNYKRRSTFENSLSLMFGLPLKESFPKYDGSLGMLLALACYKTGKLEDACAEISDLMNRKKADSAYLKCIRDYMSAKKAGKSIKEMEMLLNTFYSEDVVKKVILQFNNNGSMFDHFYHRPNCWDCANCVSRSACFYPDNERVLMKLKERYAENPTDQLGNKMFFNSIL